MGQRYALRTIETFLFLINCFLNTVYAYFTRNVYHRIGDVCAERNGFMYPIRSKLTNVIMLKRSVGIVSRNKAALLVLVRADVICKTVALVSSSVFQFGNL